MDRRQKEEVEEEEEEEEEAPELPEFKWKWPEGVAYMWKARAKAGKRERFLFLSWGDVEGGGGGGDVEGAETEFWFVVDIESSTMEKDIAQFLFPLFFLKNKKGKALI